MSDSNKKVKKLTKLNLILSIIMLLFCFRNWQVDIEGVCEECASDFMWLFIMGFFFLIIQIVIGTIMCCLLIKQEKKWKFILLIIFAVINIFPALMQVVIFLENVEFIRCGNLSSAALIEIKKLEIQFVVARIINFGLVVLNIFLIQFYGGKLMEMRKMSITN